MPPSEPTPADVAAVAAAVGEQPTPQPAPQPAPPAPTPPSPPAAQPAPTPQVAPTEPADPFTALFNQPAEPPVAEAPSTPPQPPQPPTPPAAPPAVPAQPETSTPPAAPAAVATPEPQYQSYEEYIDSILQGVKQPDKTTPDPEKIDPNDPAAIKTFFDEIVNTAVSRAEQATVRRQAIQAAERNLWDAAFDKYNSLRTNKPLRDMVHAIRMGHFQRGVALTPTQAADKLLESLGQQYRRGVADNQVQTTIENVQPTGGSSQTVPTTLDKEATLTAVQTGGETALAEILDAEIRAGRL